MSNSDRRVAAEDDSTAGLGREELYTVVHTAVRDALLDVLGTVALLGFALLSVGIGGRSLFVASSTVGTVFGASVLVFGFVIAAVALDFIPP
jgi:hypothetical protein